MFLRSAEQLRQTGREMVVANGNARTIRMITAADEIGFSLSNVRLKAAQPPNFGTNITGKRILYFQAAARWTI